jgi:hypothetical protein
MGANTVVVAADRSPQRYRELVCAELAQNVASGEKVKEEMRHFLGVLAQRSGTE